MNELNDTAIRKVVRPKPAGDKSRAQASFGAIAVERDRQSYADWERAKCAEQGYLMSTVFKEPLL